MKNTEIFEMLLFGIVLPYMVFKMQQPDPKDVEKRKAVTAACTQELQAALGREPEQSEISRAVADRPSPLVVYLLVSDHQSVKITQMMKDHSTTPSKRLTICTRLST